MTTTAITQKTAPRQAEVPEISILLHVTDAEARVDVLVSAYARVLAEMGRTGELVFILDGVAGSTLEALEALQASRDDVRVLALQGGGHGESIAFKAALEYSAGRYLLTTWDYFQVDPRELVALMKALEDGQLDLVSSWRWPRVDPVLNRLQSTLFNWVLRVLSRVDLHDLNCNFRLMRREVMEEVTLYGDLFRFLPIMASRRGFKVREVKVRHVEERGKTGFFGLGVYVRRSLDILAVTFLTRFTRKPLRFFGIIGFALVLVGLVMTLPPLYERLFLSESIQDRPIVLVGVVLGSFGLQFIGFGLVGEIIIFTQSRNLKDYKIEQVLDSTSVPEAAAEAPMAEGAAVAATPSETGVIVRHVAPGEDVVLDHYVAGHERGTLFHLAAWRRMVEEACGRTSEVLVAERTGKIVGFLPWVNWKSMFLGRVSVSMPFAVYGGCVADDGEAAARLIQGAAEQCDAAGSSYLELRHFEGWSEASGVDLESVSRYVTFVRDLPSDPEACLGIIPRKARAEARRGREAGLEFVEAMDLPLFHRLFAANKQVLGSPALPMSILQGLMRHMGDALVMHQVRLPDGTCIAAVLSFLFRDLVLPYYSGALHGYDKLGANNFMYWKLMEWASARGIARFDFGRSRQDSGAAKFKKNMGFSTTVLRYEYHLGVGGKVPEFHPDNPKLSAYQRLWRRLPAPLARGLGAKLFKHVP